MDSLGIIGRLVSLQAPSPYSVPPRISLRVGVPTNTLTKARDRVRNNPRRRWIHEWSHTHWSGNGTVSAQQIFPNFFCADLVASRRVSCSRMDEDDLVPCSSPARQHIRPRWNMSQHEKSFMDEMFLADPLTCGPGGELEVRSQVAETLGVDPRRNQIQNRRQREAKLLLLREHGTDSHQPSAVSTAAGANTPLDPLTPGSPLALDSAEGESLPPPLPPAFSHLVRPWEEASPPSSSTTPSSYAGAAGAAGAGSGGGSGTGAGAVSTNLIQGPSPRQGWVIGGIGPAPVAADAHDSGEATGAIVSDAHIPATFIASAAGAAISAAAAVVAEADRQSVAAPEEEGEEGSYHDPAGARFSTEGEGYNPDHDPHHDRDRYPDPHTNPNLLLSS